jgi:hypothetical protein
MFGLFPSNSLKNYVHVGDGGKFIVAIKIFKFKKEIKSIPTYHNFDL